MFMMSNSQAFCGAANVGFYPTQRLPLKETSNTNQRISISRDLDSQILKVNLSMSSGKPVGL